MSITVAMIEEKEFKTKVRGYDPVEVDEFLDEICDEMVLLQDEIANLQARLAQATRAQTYAAPMVNRPQPADDHASAKKMLERAQRLYDETIEDAQREADRIIAEAKAQVIDADSQKLEGQRDALQQQVDELRAQTIRYRNQLLDLMQQQREMLDKLTTL
ncbi:MAG: DivIVA domain-containing protein [Clostridia bacterium]|nr:DivIVA domain-containing protein [Clostridia bacterium]